MVINHYGGGGAAVLGFHLEASAILWVRLGYASSRYQELNTHQISYQLPVHGKCESGAVKGGASSLQLSTLLYLPVSTF